MFRNKTHSKVCAMVSLGILAMSSLTVVAADPTQTAEILTFEQAIKVAQKNDPWLKGNRHQQDAIESSSIAANTLPDPKISVGLASLPTDGFDFNQEGMTQFKVGISQMVPRGDTLEIRSRQLKIKSQGYPFQRKNREAQVAVTVGQLWLDAYRVQESVALIERDRSLFLQLADVAEASYSAALGRTRQADIIRAQLELTHLDERLDVLAQEKNKFEGKLSQWLTDYLSGLDDNTILANLALHDMYLGKKIPQIDLQHGELVYAEKWRKPEQLVSYFTRHPAVIALDKRIAATKTGIALAKEKYKPEWGVNAGYGYRGDDPTGSSRADLLSVGVTFDLPLFTDNKQDQDVKTAISQTEAIKTEKLLLLRQLLSNYSSAKGRLLRLNDQQRLYREKLLPQMYEQAEASLTAYTNDDGDFAEVVRARIEVLNAEIKVLTLDVKQQKILLELNYLFIGA
ncbi:MAG: transporter [Gammaproteobacteria bacterium]|nr:MAG: transporter [Gammaproteobacteria bacterium]